MTSGSSQLLAVGGIDPTRIGAGWHSWLIERRPQTVTVDEFPDGELQVRLPPVGTHVDVFCDFRVSDTYKFDMRLVLDVCAVARGARQQGSTVVRLVTPELPCMRQDRPIIRSDSVELAARDLLLDLLAAAGFNTVCANYMKWDVTSASLQLRYPTEYNLANWFVSSGYFHHGAVIALDQGSASLAAAIAKIATVPTVILGKRRSDGGIVHAPLSEADRDQLAVAGSALLVDDLLVSGQSLRSAALTVAQSGSIDVVDAFIWHCRPRRHDVATIAQQLQKTEAIGMLMTSNLAPGVHGATLIPADALLADVLEHA